MSVTEKRTDRRTAPRPPRVRTVLWRGARRRCPHCGRGALFVRWITFHPRCAACGLVFLRNQGDTWLFWIVMDRIPILAGIAAIYFGFRITGWLSGALFFLAIAGPLILTMPPSATSRASGSATRRTRSRRSLPTGTDVVLS